MEWRQYLHPTVAGEELAAEALGDAVRGILRQANRQFSVSVLSAAAVRRAVRQGKC